MNLCEARLNLTDDDLGVLACPVCRGALRFEGRTGAPEDDGARALRSGALRCAGCDRSFRVSLGIPQLVERRSVTGRDSMLRPIYDLIAPSHDLGVDLVLPLLQYPDPDASRDRYIAALQLERLEPRDTPIRILEVGVGAGANIPLLRRHLPMDLDVDIWGLDLSPGMLLQCSLRAQLFYPGRPRLLQGDAHNLPFADATFDRVFHVGGINGYRDIRRGLAEMARVARPGTPIVVVDEELDPDRGHAPWHELAFRSLTWFDPDPRAPVDLVPERAVGVEVTRVSRFYYCLSFRMPEADAAASRKRPRQAARNSDRKKAAARRKSG